MTRKEELEKLRQNLLEIRARETLYRHIADKQPEMYEDVNRRLKVIKRRMLFLKSKDRSKKGRK